MTPVNHLAPKGNHVPLIEYIGTPSKRLGRREGLKSFARSTENSLGISEAIDQAIASLMRSGGLDSPECQILAVRTLCDLFRLRFRQAARLWVEAIRNSRSNPIGV